MEKQVKGANPTGTIISYMGNTPPSGYLPCDGKNDYLIAEYQALANQIEEQFGSKNYFGGDGTTTFAVPDLRGEFLRGTGTNGHTRTDIYGNNKAGGSGKSVGEHQSATQHTAIWANDTRTIVANGLTGTMPQNDAFTSISMKSTRVSSNSTANNSMAIFFTSRPTNTSVLYCIKY